MFFFFNDTATTEIYTLSLHDALPIYDFGDGERAARLPHGPVPDSRNRHQRKNALDRSAAEWRRPLRDWSRRLGSQDRKSTRLNSSHSQISYAVFCLKKKNISHIVTLYILLDHIIPSYANSLPTGSVRSRIAQLRRLFLSGYLDFGLHPIYASTRPLL